MASYRVTGMSYGRPGEKYSGINKLNRAAFVLWAIFIGCVIAALMYGWRLQLESKPVSRAHMFHNEITALRVKMAKISSDITRLIATKTIASRDTATMEHTESEKPERVARKRIPASVIQVAWTDQHVYFIDEEGNLVQGERLYSDYAYYEKVRKGKTRYIEYSYKGKHYRMTICGEEADGDGGPFDSGTVINNLEFKKLLGKIPVLDDKP